MARTQGQFFPGSQRCLLFTRGSRLIALAVAVLLTLETAGVAGAQQSAAPRPPIIPSQAPQSQNKQTEPPPGSTSQLDPVDDSRNSDAAMLPSAPTPMLAQQEPAQQPAQSPPAQQQTAPQQPVGTAAAPYEKPTGVAGSRPAGAAIAPARQRRVRALVIRVGIVLAAGAAVGAVVGLSKATHSAPQ